MESFEAIGKSFAGYGTDAKVSVEGQISKLEGFNKNWERRVKKNPYFRLYMRNLFKKKEFEPPTLMDSLSRDIGALEEPNLIYPVGDPVFIHIIVEGKNKDLIYKPIEPRLMFNRDWILAEVEKRIALSIDDTVSFKSVEKKTNYLNEVLKNIVVVNRKLKPGASRVEPFSSRIASNCSPLGNGPEAKLPWNVRLSVPGFSASPSATMSPRISMFPLNSTTFGDSMNRMPSTMIPLFSSAT